MVTEIIAIELGILICLQAYSAWRSHAPRLVRAPNESGQVLVWKGKPGQHLYCQRPEDSPDLVTFRDTPGFWLEYPSGELVAGKQ